MQLYFDTPCLLLPYRSTLTCPTIMAKSFTFLALDNGGPLALLWLSLISSPIPCWPTYSFLFTGGGKNSWHINFWPLLFIWYRIDVKIISSFVDTNWIPSACELMRVKICSNDAPNGMLTRDARDFPRTEQTLLFKETGRVALPSCWTLVLMMTKKQRCKLSSELMSYLSVWFLRYQWKELGEYEVKEEVKRGFQRLSKEVSRSWYWSKHWIKKNKSKTFYFLVPL